MQPVNRVIKTSKFREDEERGGGYEPFDSILAREMSKKKEKGKEKKKEPEVLRRLEGLNQYDARANAFFFRLASTADYRA